MTTEVRIGIRNIVSSCDGTFKADIMGLRSGKPSTKICEFYLSHTWSQACPFVPKEQYLSADNFGLFLETLRNIKFFLLSNKTFIEKCMFWSRNIYSIFWLYLLLLIKSTGMYLYDFLIFISLLFIRSRKAPTPYICKWCQLFSTRVFNSSFYNIQVFIQNKNF